METNRKYQFHWGLLGDLELGRPNLGKTMRVETYRLMQFTFRDVLEQNYGSEEADKIFYEAGKLAGTEFYKQNLHSVGDAKDFVGQLKSALKEWGIGILRIEDIDLDKGELTLTVSEDLDCSGLPENGIEICVYDEGFIAAILESYFHKPFSVKEVDCWCTGDRTCRFFAHIED